MTVAGDSSDRGRRCVLVTGAGRGLGRAIAERFRAQAYTVVATDYDVDLLADLQGVEGYLCARFDVSEQSAAVEIAEQIRRETGRLDVIVNNAGVNAFYPISEAPPAMTVQAFHINTFSALYTTQACLDLLIASKGVIVNISSESSPLRTPFQYYQSTKMALEALSDVLRRELKLFDVHVAIVRPGAIQTSIIEGTRNVRNALPDSRFEKVFEKYARAVARNVPKRVSQPAEVAEVVFQAATDPKRKPMYRINNSLVLALLGMLPTRLADRLLTV